MNKEVEERKNIEEIKIYTQPRKSGAYLNVYIELDGMRFELVPHCRTVREKAYFYNLLARSPLALNK